MIKENPESLVAAPLAPQSATSETFPHALAGYLTRNGQVGNLPDCQRQIEDFMNDKAIDRLLIPMSTPSGTSWVRERFLGDPEDLEPVELAPADELIQGDTIRRILSLIACLDEALHDDQRETTKTAHSIVHHIAALLSPIGDIRNSVNPDEVAEMAFNASRIAVVAQKERDEAITARTRDLREAKFSVTPSAPDELDEDDEDALLSCPFCGGIPQFGESPDGGHFIECSECQASTNLTYYLMDDASRDVRERWNRREL